MKAREFLNQLHHDEVVSAIREAEKKTSGEIRVFITRKDIEEPVEIAKRHFIDVGMEKTRERNGVLIFVAPRTQKFAVIGDTAIHERCGEEFWRELTAEMHGHFRDSDFTKGLVHVVKKAGDLLAKHFPRKPDDKNELPDTIIRD
jgi:uncharacterized membrane protein